MEMFNTVLHSAAGRFYVGDPEIVLSRSILHIRKAGRVIELVPEGVLVDDDDPRDASLKTVYSYVSIPCVEREVEFRDEDEHPYRTKSGVISFIPVELISTAMQEKYAEYFINTNILRILHESPTEFLLVLDTMQKLHLRA